MPPLIAFDLDGTIINSQEDIADAVNECRMNHGLAPLLLETVTSYTGNGATKLMERSVPELLQAGLSLQDLLTEELGYYEKRLVNKTRLYPGVAETLPILANHFKLAAISNKRNNLSVAVLEKLGVLQYFSSVLGSGRIPEKKPQPEPIFFAAKETGATLEGSWMVGDNWTDMGAAQAAKIRGCFCAYGFGNMRNGYHADAVIYNFRTLLKIKN